MPISGRRSQAPSTASRFIIGSPMPMKTAWSTGPRRRKCRAWSTISAAVRLRPKRICPVAQNCAGQRAARLRGEAQRAPAVAVGHQNGLDRPAVGGPEQRLDRTVAGVRLVLGGKARERDRVGQAAAQLERQIGHLLDSRPRPAPPSARPGAPGKAGSPRSASVRSRRAKSMLSMVAAAMRLAKYLATPASHPAGRPRRSFAPGGWRVGGETVLDPARSVSAGDAVTVDGDAGRSAVATAGRVRAQQARRCRVHGQRHPRPADRRLAGPERRSPLPGGAARHRLHRPDPAHRRRRARPPADPSSLRGAKDLPRDCAPATGRRDRRCASCARASSSRTG